MSKQDAKVIEESLEESFKKGILTAEELDEGLDTLYKSIDETIAASVVEL